MSIHAKTILLVDDDTDLHTLVRSHLEMSGYRVLDAFSGEHALDAVESRGLPHLALVDIYMPGMGGLEFCRRLQGFSDVPVIMLTAETDADVIVGAIELYAEDYIIKPFNARELVVRVERLLRRILSFEYTTAPVIRIDDQLQINFGKQEVLLRGNHVSLTPTETKLLHIFLNNANRIVTLEFLLNRLWPRQEVYEDTLRVHIHRLRQKIENKQQGRVYITTERGQGYRFWIKDPDAMVYEFDAD